MSPTLQDLAQRARRALGALAGGAALALAAAPRVYDLAGLGARSLAPEIDPAQVVAMEHSPGAGRLAVAGFVASLLAPALAQVASGPSPRARRALRGALVALGALSALRRPGAVGALPPGVAGVALAAALVAAVPVRGRARRAQGAVVAGVGAALLGWLARELPRWERTGLRALYIAGAAEGRAGERAMDAALASAALLLAAGLWALHDPEDRVGPGALGALVVVTVALPWAV